MNVNENITNKNPTQSLKQMETEILTYINYNFPNYHNGKILDHKKEKIKRMASLFDEFDEIHSEREKYNLHWAFKKAHDAFQFNEAKKSSSTEDCFKQYDEVSKYVANQAINRVNWFSRSFSVLNHGVSILDIVVSVILILVVTQISHIGDYFFETVLLSTLFIAFVALVKVSLDRFFIIPLIDRWGWRFYQRMTNYTRNELIKLNATFLVLMESIAQEESLEKRFEIISKQRREIFSQRRWFSRPQPWNVASLQEM
ncbi:MAG: hypothetical protein ACW981_17175 [Candidatus Hodarchaeales archaeon]|jgi:hypothetical protein